MKECIIQDFKPLCSICVVKLLFKYKQESMLRQQQRSMSHQSREERRKKIFELHRIYAEQPDLIQRQNHVNPGRTRISTNAKKQISDPEHSTIISTFSQEHQKPRSIQELILLLQQGNWVLEYKVICSLDKMGDKIFTIDIQERVLGRGIVPQLAKILLRSQHPFLQLKALAFLEKMAINVRKDRFWIYFNKTTIPFVFLMSCFNSEEVNVVESALAFASRLTSKKYDIPAEDSNVQFVDILLTLAVRWETEKNILEKISALASHFKPKFYPNSQRFESKLFELMSRLVEFELGSVQPSNVIKNVLFWMSDGYLVKRMCKLIDTTSLARMQNKHPTMKKLLRQLYFLPLDLPCVEVSWWKWFVSPFIPNKAGLSLLQDFGIRQKVERLLMLTDRSEQYRLSIVEVYKTLLLHSPERDMIKMTENSLFFREIQTLYKTGKKPTIKSLNFIVLSLLENVSQSNNILKMMLDHNILKAYLDIILNQYGSYFNYATSRLKTEIEKIGRIPSLWEQYLQLVNCITEDKIFENIIKRLRQYNFNSEVCWFFEGLKPIKVPEPSTVVSLFDELISPLQEGNQTSIIRFLPL